MRFRIKLITLTAVGMMLVMTVAYLRGFERMSWERANAYFESNALEVEHRLASQLQYIAATARMTAYSSTLQTYLLDESASARMRVMAPGTDIMQKAIDANAHIMDIVLYSRGGRLLFARGCTRPVARAMLEDYGLHADASLRQPFFTRTYDEYDMAAIKHAFYLMPIYNTLPGQFSVENVGLCAIQFRVDTLCDDLRARGQPEGLITLVMEGGKLLSASEALSRADVERLGGLGEEQARVELASAAYLARMWTDADTGWKIIAATPVGELERDILPLKYLGQTIFIASILLLGVLMLATVRSISVPLGKLLRDIGRIGTAREGFRMQTPATRELALIARQINRVLERVEVASRAEKAAQAALYEASIARQRAELISYRSQINPHFLYNTLECIRAMAQHYGACGIEKICLSMSRMFRYSVREDEQVTVRDELANVRDYFTVMTERMRGTYRLMIRVTAEARARPIQKMILQPIVENAIKHGFSGKEPPCNVCIQGYVGEDKKLVLRISDNGVGLAEEALAKLRGSIGDAARAGGDCASIGLSNIDHRLRLSFGEGYTLAIRSRLNCYTSIELVLPNAGGGTDHAKLR